MSDHKADTEKLINVALVGAPNSGKTTLYNWLTGSNFKTVNYPGATVEYSVGHVNPALGSGINFIDTPGTYSLHPKSADEEVTLRALYENERVGDLSGLIVVVDGTQLSRHLLLARQVHEAGFPFILVVTMADLLLKENLYLPTQDLKNEFGAQEVIFFDGILGAGLREIVEKAKLLNAVAKPLKPQLWGSERLEKELVSLEKKLSTWGLGGVSEKKKLNKVFASTAIWDRWLLHPWIGLIVFFLIMSLIFASIYWLAQPFMDFIDFAFSFIADQILALAPGQLWADFISQGIIKSFAAVLVFLPQIFILFFGIGILESSGYLARAATLIDRPLSAVGLSGRSFVPLLSGFACAVPALIATRNIASKRDRFITQMIIPLMTCSARLPVYALLIGFLYPGNALVAGMTLAGLYFAALVIGAIAAGIIDRFIPKEKNSFFMMELPLYRRPRFRVLLKQSWNRTQSYVKRAGPVIFVIAVLLWLGTNFPYNDDILKRTENSYAAQVGRFIEPVFLPMGVDWRVGFGLLSAFAAREVFVSSMAVVLHVTNTNEDSLSESLISEMNKAQFPDGQKIFTLSSVLGLIVFFMIALQCMSTVATMHREAASWKMALLQLVLFNVIAYILSVGLVQGLRFIGVA
ncbi:MAG: ferrous iron transporter B [Bdellovibrionota bacterium]